MGHGRPKLKTPATEKISKGKDRDARLPAAGTLLKKKHGDSTHNVKVLAEGFDYRGKHYRSLSAVAKEITGTIWNGFAFFGLTREAGK